MRSRRGARPEAPVDYGRDAGDSLNRLEGFVAGAAGGGKKPTPLKRLIKGRSCCDTILEVQLQPRVGVPACLREAQVGVARCSHSRLEDSNSKQGAVLFAYHEGSNQRATPFNLALLIGVLPCYLCAANDPMKAALPAGALCCVA